MDKIILASQSPRRRELLSQIGIEFECMPSDEEEIVTTSVPSQAAKELAVMKALNISKKIEGRCILAADTVVEYNNNILGKPKDEDDARRMLKMLSGNKHSVHTGVCIIDQNSIINSSGETKFRQISFVCHTNVYMNVITDEEIEEYIASKEPMDKAGAYAIQGRAAAFVSHIEGDFYNVVGLPVSEVYKILKQLY